MASIVVAGDTSGTVTLTAPAVSGTTTLTLPTTSGTIIAGTAPSGALVGTTDTQTLTNKTLGAGTVMPTGSVLQVVSSTTSTRTTSTSASYVDANLSASITPSSASNNILVIVTYTLAADTSSYAGWSQLVRGATQIAQRTYYTAAANAYASMSASLSILDSPATTSSTTYKMQIRTDGAGTVSFNGPTTMSYSTGTPTNYSAITLMEIKG
jgi:hypothetical protein